MLGTPVSLLVGIVLLLSAVVLFFLDKLRPAVSRDSDKVYAIFILMAGLLALAIQEITLGESFQMMLMAGMLTTLYIENVGNREPREVVPGPPAGNRPPMPRYDERPPVRRGYRAELDNRPEFRGPQPPRMNPMQPPMRQDAYANGQVRPPYEEYRGPAGRLQPSRPDGRPSTAGGPPNPGYPDSGYPDNGYSDNGRYGERPPTPQPQRQGPPDSFRGPEGGSRPPETIAKGQVGERPPRPESPQNNERDRPENGESSARGLNIRPLSEAPKFDDEYRPNGKPAGAPSDY